MRRTKRGFRVSDSRLSVLTESVSVSGEKRPAAEASLQSKQKTPLYFCWILKTVSTVPLCQCSVSDCVMTVSNSAFSSLTC